MADTEARDAGVRTRFAPSPTGFLHVGTARTALFSYLFARRHEGTFVLRIEDTDVERNVEGGADSIAEALGWLGLDWDEGYGRGGPHGPYVQSERLPRYRDVADHLAAGGHAYRCWCTPEELDQRRAAAEAAGRPPGYDGRCRDLSGEQVAAFQAEGRVPAVRFRMPDEGVTEVDDLVRGHVVFDNATLTDFIILRASGMPTYMLSAVVDDADMAISHVIRGEDLFSSTPRQVRVFAALGARTPAFAHLPLLVGTDRRKLSKRRGQVSLQAFRAQGYLPEAMVNYLALLGWSLDDHTEVFTLAELEQQFSIERVSHNPAAFDTKKLDALNGVHLRRLPPEEFARRALEFVRAGGRPDASLEVMVAATPLVQERVTRLDEVPAMVGFLYEGGGVELDAGAAAKVLTGEALDFLAAAAQRLERCDPWAAAGIEESLRALQTERGIGAKRAFQPVRLAVTGRLVSPPLFESMELLGRERSLERIRAALTAAG